MTFLSILYSLGSSLTTLLLLLTFLILLFIVICLNLLVSFPFPSLCSPPLLLYFPSLPFPFPFLSLSFSFLLPLLCFLIYLPLDSPNSSFPSPFLYLPFPLLYLLPYSLSFPCSLFLFIPPLVYLKRVPFLPISPPFSFSPLPSFLRSFLPA